MTTFHSVSKSFSCCTFIWKRNLLYCNVHKYLDRGKSNRTSTQLDKVVLIGRTFTALSFNRLLKSSEKKELNNLFYIANVCNFCVSWRAENNCFSDNWENKPNTNPMRGKFWSVLHWGWSQLGVGLGTWSGLLVCLPASGADSIMLFSVYLPIGYIGRLLI